MGISVYSGLDFLIITTSLGFTRGVKFLLIMEIKFKAGVFAVKGFEKDVKVGVLLRETINTVEFVIVLELIYDS